MVNIRNKFAISRKAQMAIWFVIALAIVAAFILFYSFKKPAPTIPPSVSDPQTFILSCARPEVEAALSIMLPQGGFISPTNFKKYQQNNIAYLCLHEGYFQPCIHQHPMLLNEMSDEIREYVSPRIEECFEQLKKEFEKNQYSVALGEQNVNVSLGPNLVLLEINRRITISKSDSTRTVDKFPITVRNPAYDLANVALEIASQEAKYCYFEYVGYMLLYPRYDIRKVTLNDATRIYTIKDTLSEKVMNIATRGCVITPGL